MKKTIFLYDYMGFCFRELEVEDNVSLGAWGNSLTIGKYHFEVKCTNILDRQRDVVTRIKKILDEENVIHLICGKKENSNIDFELMAIVPDITK